MAADTFVHLHLHTEYSLLDGAVRIPDLMKKVNRCKMPAVAMTDHGSLYGAVDFYQEAKKVGVKPIIGCEVYLAPRSMEERKQVRGRKNAYHLTLLAKDAVGYANLMKLVSKAHLEGFYYKPRVDKACLAQHAEGIICLSGCLNGEVNQFIVEGQLDQARQSVRDFVEIYGKDNFYLELHDHGLEQQKRCNAQLLQFAQEFTLKPVAANDVHFLNQSDHEAHDVMICIGTGAQLQDENRMQYSDQVYFKTATEMKKLFKQVPEALANTLEIAERCDFEMELDAASSAKYPQFMPPDGSSRENYFEKLCYDGLKKRYGERAESARELKERLQYEMDILERMGFVSYFLITWDFIRDAKSRGIPVGPGRGSAAGSLVAYCLEITDLCPFRFGLVFERFLNPERIEPPDVDIDFCQSRRGEVIEYVSKKYGEKAVSHIITFGKLGAKSVVRDVGRVMGVSYGDADRIAKMIPNELGINLAKALKKNSDLKQAVEQEAVTAQLWDYATYLEGLTRNVGVHAAGVVIGACELDEHVPLTRSNDGEIVTQFAMRPLTELGMLKMDFLGLKTLTVIQDAVNLIRKHTPEFSIETVSLEDEQTFTLLNSGETVGIFQLESGGMVNLCKQMGVDRIDDIIALIALYRPGPMDLIPEYIERKKGKRKIQYEHPLLEKVCADTYGIMIYQEQVMQAANLLAGYTLGDADLLRKAMGKKLPEKMAVERKRFIKGCREKNGIPEKKANAIFDLLEKFAGYGFNKSHSTAYAMISYRTAYLKANYPVEFMAALLSNEVNNTDKISVFVNECKRMDIDILPPHINRSQLTFAPEENGEQEKGIRYGLAAIKNVGEGAMQVAITERNTNGEYRSLEDFAMRLDSRVVNRKNLESLIKVGAFDFIGELRASLFSRLNQVIGSSASSQKDRQSGQEALFDVMDYTTAKPVKEDQDIQDWDLDEVLAYEKDLLGFYVTGHPLDAYRSIFVGGKYQAIGEINQLKESRTKYHFAGFVENMRIKYTKREGKPFAILSLEDFTGAVEVMVWNEVYGKVRDILEKRNVLSLSAVIESDDRTGTRRLVAQSAQLLQPQEAEYLLLQLPSREKAEKELQQIHAIVESYRGETPLHLQLTALCGECITVIAGNRYAVDSANRELREKLRPWLV